MFLNRGSHRDTLIRFVLGVAVAAVLLLAAALVIGASRAAARGATATLADHAGMAMSDAAMREMSRRFYAAHPPRGAGSTATPAATFTASGFVFDSDGNSGTPVDTAKILVGSTVLWQWVSLTHTVTSGTGSSDPQVGMPFDQPLDSAHMQFSFTFNTVGTFPFFCRFHELSNMRGAVVVKSSTGVEPGLPDGGLGFVAAPSPNPTRSGLSFQFAVRTTGRVRVQVFDARGRLVAHVVDRDLAAGVYAMSWDGRSGSGVRPGPGIYYLRLELPGLRDSRRFVLFE